MTLTRREFLGRSMFAVPGIVLATPLLSNAIQNMNSHKMKAYQIDQINQTVNLVDVDMPKLTKRNEILIRNLKFSICRTDVSQVKHELGEESHGLIPGHEVLGMVVASNDPDFKKGDYIVYFGGTDFGGAAEYRKLMCVLPNDPIKDENEGNPTTWFQTERYFYDVYGAAAVKINKENAELLRYGSLIEPLSCILRAMEKHAPITGKNAIILGGGCVGILALQCLKNIYGVKEVLIIDVDQKKLQKIPELFPEYKNSLKTLHVDKGTRKSSEFKDRWVKATNGAYAPYLFEAMPPKIDVDSREIGSSLLSPNGHYILFTATASEENTSFFWNILAKGINLKSSGFDQQCFPMPESASIIQKAHAYANTGIINLKKVVTKEINFFEEKDVKLAFAQYGKGEHMWKTVVTIHNG